MYDQLGTQINYDYDHNMHVYGLSIMDKVIYVFGSQIHQSKLGVIKMFQYDQ